MIRNYCTYFDRNYLTRALALYESLVRHANGFRLFVLCFDSETFRILTELRLPQVVPIALEELLRDDPALADARANRSAVEFYFTCSPSLPRFLFRRYPEIDLLTYLDADLFFYSSPEPLFEELADRSIGIVGHRFPPGMEHMNAYGIYNVGLLIFRRGELALACLEWWRARCLESCATAIERGIYGDQKYLDDWPTRFSGVAVLQHKGANVGVWNLSGHDVNVRANVVHIDDQPLIFFHFHGLKRPLRWFLNFHFSFYRLNPNSVVTARIFRPYVRSLLRLERVHAAASPAQAAPTLLKEIGADLLRRNGGILMARTLVVAPRWLSLIYCRWRSRPA